MTRHRFRRKSGEIEWSPGSEARGIRADANIAALSAGYGNCGAGTEAGEGVVWDGGFQEGLRTRRAQETRAPMADTAPDAGSGRMSTRGTSSEHMDWLCGSGCALACLAPSVLR
jgi:hypothetical protein